MDNVSIYVTSNKGAPSEVQATMIQQLNALHPYWRGEFGVEMIVKDGEETLRLPFKIGRHRVNVDLTYDHGEDLYNVRAVDVDRFTRQIMNMGTPTPEEWEMMTRDATILDSRGLFWDSLIDTFREVAAKVDR